MTEIDTYLNDIQTQFGSAYYVKLIKTGKEAEVHLLNVEGVYMALKIYKENTKFSSREQYFDISEIGDKRLIRGAKKKTRKGLGAIKNIWMYREYQTLQKLYDCGALVPKPYMIIHQGILMEYLGYEDTCAPRLSEIEISREDAQESFNIIIEHLLLFVEMGFTLGDLSSFNILWYKNLPYFIDFPQIVHIEKRNFREKLDTDIKNVEKYFKRYRLPNMEKRINSVYQRYFESLI